MMKTKMIASICLLLSMFLIEITNAKPKLGVLYIDTQGLTLTPQQMGNLVRIELEKLDTFEVIDRYDIAYFAKEKNEQLDNCYGKQCLIEMGQKLQVEKMLGGSVEVYGETTIITLRLVDVKKATIEKTVVKEYKKLPSEIQTMIRVSIQELFNYAVDPLLQSSISKESNYDNLVNNPGKNALNLNGPRMGFLYLPGKMGDVLTKSKDNGGNGTYPGLFMIGYQFELQYLNEGTYQALFEIVPAISGLDQNLFIPSLAIVNGIRSSFNGWEFGVGPNFSVTKRARGYYNATNQWVYEKNKDVIYNAGYTPDNREDLNGDDELSTRLIFIVGKTFRSGKLNFPVNMFVMPSKDGVTMGATFGYNMQKNRKVEVKQK